MKEMTKKVVILNNFASPYISQAIIVLKDYDPKLEGKVIADAEKIVSRYIEKTEKSGQPRRAVRQKGKWLKISVGLIVTALIYGSIKYFII